MPVPKEVLWELEPPTLGKHFVLREYLKAWLPILSMYGNRLVFIDAFAGPGEYKGGEEGSPQIALRTAVEHSARKKFQDVRFLFVEEDPARFAHLDALLKRTFPTLPKEIHVDTYNGSFRDIVGGLLASIRSQGQQLAPALLFVDPFGVKGVPLSILENFLQGEKKEILISFMAESVRRFARTDEFEGHLDELFGTAGWRSCIGDGDALEALYERRLRQIGGKYVLRFLVKSGGRHIYTLFFVTKHLAGCDKMKTAMWKAAPNGSFSYEPNAVAVEREQYQLFDLKASDIANDIQAHLRQNGPQSIEALQEWVKGDATLFYSGQLKSALKSLENSGVIVGSRDGQRRSGTFPNGTRISLA